MEGIIVGDKTPERRINKTEDIKNVVIPEVEKSPEEQITSISNEINKEENTIISTKNSIDKIRQELGLVGEETNIPSIEFNKNKKSKLEKALSLISSNVSGFTKVAAVSAGLFAGGNNLEANNIKQNQGDKFTQGVENVSSIEDDKTKTLNGGNIEEVVVYGKKQYEEELSKQEANIKKFGAEMAKYQKDSVEWAKANEAYNDSLKLYNDANYNIDFLSKLKFSINGDDKIEKLRLDFIDATKDRKVDPATIDKLSEESNIKPTGHGLIAYGYRDNDKNANEYTPSIQYKKDSYPELLHDNNDRNNDKSYGLWSYFDTFNKPKGKIVTPPQKPENPANKEIKYDPKFEDLNMRSLWATILKQDPNAKIGTLHVLDPQFEKGFTLEEAMAFPQEIKDKYNIDYIYNQIHGAEKSPKDYKHPGWDYNNSKE